MVLYKKIEDFFNVSVKDIPTENGRFRINHEKFETFYPNLHLLTQEELKKWAKECDKEYKKYDEDAF